MYIPSSTNVVGSSCGAVSKFGELAVSSTRMSTYNDNKNENKQLIGV
jgi:hypothetical protein